MEQEEKLSLDFGNGEIYEVWLEVATYPADKNIKVFIYNWLFYFSTCNLFRKIPVAFIHVNISRANSRNCTLTCILPHISVAIKRIIVLSYPSGESV